MNIQQLSVRQRLYAGFGLILGIIVVLTAMAIVNVNAINAALKANSDEHAAIQRTVRSRTSPPAWTRSRRARAWSATRDRPWTTSCLRYTASRG